MSPLHRPASLEIRRGPKTYQFVSVKRSVRGTETSGMAIDDERGTCGPEIRDDAWSRAPGGRTFDHP